MPVASAGLQPITRSAFIDPPEVRLFGRTDQPNLKAELESPPRHPAPTRPAGSNPRAPDPRRRQSRRRTGSFDPRRHHDLATRPNRPAHPRKTAPSVPVQRQPRADSNPGRHLRAAPSASTVTAPAAGRTTAAYRIVPRERSNRSFQTDDADLSTGRTSGCVPTQRLAQADSNPGRQERRRAGRTNLGSNSTRSP